MCIVSVLRSNIKPLVGHDFTDLCGLWTTSFATKTSDVQHKMDHDWPFSKPCYKQFRSVWSKSFDNILRFHLSSACCTVEILKIWNLLPASVSVFSKLSVCLLDMDSWKSYIQLLLKEVSIHSSISQHFWSSWIYRHYCFPGPKLQPCPEDSTYAEVFKSMGLLMWIEPVLQEGLW